MYIDKGLNLSAAQAVTAAAASTNIIDIGSARDLGPSDLYALVTVDEAVTAAGAATVQFQLQCDSDSAFGTVKTVIQTDAIPKATLIPGYQLILPLPPGLDKRYVRLYYNVGTGPLTAGKFTASIVDKEQMNKTYAANQV